MIIVSYEDTTEEMLRPRVEAAGGDLGRVFDIVVPDHQGPVVLPSDLAELRECVRSVQARLVIIDPVVAAIDVNYDAHKDQHVRAVLAELAAVAAEEEIAVAIVGHLNKAPSRDAYIRVANSVAFWNAARSVVLVTEDPDEPDSHRLVAQRKANFARLAPIERHRIDAIILFRRKREADGRRRWIDGELAARRVPELHFAATPAETTLAAAARRWQASRVDVSLGTAQTYKVALGRLLPGLGNVPVSKLDAQTVAALVAELHGAGLKKQTIRKTVSVLAMVLDHERIEPNPARDKLTVKLPREERRELHPPTAAHVEAVVRLLPTRYRLPALVLDASGMRIGELEGLTWGDVDEPRQRWRVSAGVAKTGRAAGCRFRTYCSSRDGARGA